MKENLAVKMQNIFPEQVSFYRVALLCHEAPEIGCGSRAKPELLALERRSEVAQAWLNRTGTLIAIVWEKQSSQASRGEVIRWLAKQVEIHPQELIGADYNSALKNFREGADWYQGAAVNRLSEEEGGIIAARLVRRLKARTTLTDEQSRVLERAFTHIIQRRLVHGSTKLVKTRHAGVESEIIKAARAHLNEQGILALQQVFALGWYPLPNEK